MAIKELAEKMPSYGYVILDYDDETVREIKSRVRAHCLTYGFQKEANLRATDSNVNAEGTNFKIS